MGDSEQKIIEIIRKILLRGNSAEIKKTKEGNWKVYEVTKHIQKED